MSDMLSAIYIEYQHRIGNIWGYVCTTEYLLTLH